MSSVNPVLRRNWPIGCSKILKFLSKRPQEALINQACILKQAEVLNWAQPYPEFNEACREQFSIAKTLKNRGCIVALISAGEIDIMIESLFPADSIIMTGSGTIRCCPEDKSRLAECLEVEEVAFQRGCNKIGAVEEGYFEGGDCVWVGPHTVMLATSRHSNSIGRAQVVSLLKEHCPGVTVIEVDLDIERLKTTYPNMRRQHLAQFLCIVTPNVAICATNDVPQYVVDALRSSLGFTSIITPSNEEIAKCACECLPVFTHTVLIASGNPILKASLEQEKNLNVLEFDLSSIVNSSGGSLSSMFVAYEFD